MLSAIGTRKTVCYTGGDLSFNHQRQSTHKVDEKRQHHAQQQRYKTADKINKKQLFPFFKNLKKWIWEYTDPRPSDCRSIHLNWDDDVSSPFLYSSVSSFSQLLMYHHLFSKSLSMHIYIMPKEEEERTLLNDQREFMATHAYIEWDNKRGSHTHTHTSEYMAT